MDWSKFAETVFMTVYTFALVAVAVYGFHRYALVVLFLRHRRKNPTPPGRFTELPHVTVQLPMYNEKYVARRIIEQTCRIDYPREKLHIQVLDDSTDHTSDIARRGVEKARALGFDIEYIHRDNREGFKAGALANGMKTAKGEFITIFDADFVPHADILKRSIHYFTDPRVCVVQTRWEHLNRADSLLTRSQAILLDGHFAIEHIARNRSQRFMNFNGTAGTWRRSAIEDAGGWQHDTLTEDLDLSFRAQLKGWKFVFLPDLTAPAELPPEMAAFKAQQFRWTKGGTQTALKLLPRLLLSKAPLKVKIEGFFQLTCFSLHLYMLMLVVMMFPAMYLRTVPVERGTFWRGAFDISIFALATMSATVFYVAAQYQLFRNWRTALKYMPVLMALGVGLSVSNSKAIIEAMLGRKSDFIRTPKYGGPRRPVKKKPGGGQGRRKRNLLPYAELLFGLYMGVCAVWSVLSFRAAITAPFLVIFTFGFLYVSTMTFQAERARGEIRAAEARAAREGT